MNHAFYLKGIFRFAELFLMIKFSTLAFTGTSVRSIRYNLGKLRNGVSPCSSSCSRPLSISRVESNYMDLQATLPTNENNNELLKIRHTSAHVMAMAVQRIYPDVKVTIGPWIENGFYYDFFAPDRVLTVDDLKKIKKEMDKIIKSNLLIQRIEVDRDDARGRIMEINEPYKLEILNDIKSDNISIYTIGNQWWDLCAGPHLESTGKLNPKSIELESVAGAYWRGNEKNAVLQRVYGTAWETPEQLSIYKLKMAEAKRRDHRAIGKQLQLFSIQEEAGGGLVFWHPKGAIVRRVIENYWENEHIKGGYQLVKTPHLANLNLWKTSGHFDFYRDDMFKSIAVTETEQLQIKPMNCPFHCLMYKDAQRSHRDLPLRMAEMGTVYRYERSGTLHGLFRVRGFTQDDAHIFCLPEQLTEEILGVLKLTEVILNKFGFFDFEVILSTRPEKSVGSDDIWDKATSALKSALGIKNWKFDVDEGGGAFYGPKIDIKIKDAIGRKWQCSTIQCDFNLPNRFGLEYMAADGSKQRPIMVHRAIFGSLERFFGVLIETTAGDFPLWLAPVQLRIVPIVDDNAQLTDFCKLLKEHAEKQGIRVDIDNSGERIAKKIRNAEFSKLPVVAVVGLQEIADKSISVRLRGGAVLGAAVPAWSAIDALAAAAKACTEFTGVMASSDSEQQRP